MTRTNTAVQLASRRAQLAAVTKQIKSGAYCAEDVAVLQERAATLRRIIANLQK